MPLQNKGQAIVDEVYRLTQFTEGYEEIETEAELQKRNQSLRKFIGNSRDALRNLENEMGETIHQRDRLKESSVSG